MVTERLETPGEDGRELERLRHDLADAHERIAATDQVLTAMARPAGELDQILDAVVDRARQLCQADVAQLHLVEGLVYRLSRSSGLQHDYLEYMEDHPIALDRGTLIGRVGLDCRPEQLADVLADPNYGRHDAQELAGYRTIMGAPMVLEDDLVGVLSVWRTEVGPFSDRAMDLLATFASQAAIAVRNLDLVHALEKQREALAGRVAQLEALRHVGETVSSTLDLDGVLSTIVAHAVELSGSDGGSVLEYDEDRQRFIARAVHGTSEDVLEVLRRVEIPLDGTFVGRAALAGRPVQIADLALATLDEHLRTLFEAGWRSIVAVPMLREDQIVGVLVVRSTEAGELAEETCEVLQTFASQSAVAIQNAHLFRELEGLNSNLGRFLPRQVVDLIIRPGEASSLESHRRRIVVVFCDLRGFTSFAESAEPEEVMQVLQGCHGALGELIFEFDGTLERFTGDGLMVFFNDPVPQDDYKLRAMRMAVAMQAKVGDLAEAWARQGFELALGIGIAEGFATLGPVGFHERLDYAAIGTVTNRAARLCAAADAWQTLADERVVDDADESVCSTFFKEMELKGFSRPARVFEVRTPDRLADEALDLRLLTAGAEVEGA